MLNPTTESELAEAVRSATGPLRIAGGGTRPVGNPVAGEVLSTAGLSGITLYEPGALTIVAAAGTPLDEISAALASENQRLPFEPMDHRRVMGTSGTPTIGGVVAANVSGSRRIQAGACRDSLIGVRFVDGAGTVIKNGGRVMKNVTGYDLVKLMAGSHGTLGVLSEVAFKVLPATPYIGTLIIEGLDVGQAVAAMSDALKSPFEVSGAAYLPEKSAATSRTVLRVEGFEVQVTHRTRELSRLLDGRGALRLETDPKACAALWQSVRDVEPLAEVTGDLWRISVKPSDSVEVASRLAGHDLLVDWGGGLVWAVVPEGTDLRATLDGVGGHATLVRAEAQTRKALGTFHPEAAPVAALSRGLREKFDPRGILNPGLMG